MNSAQCTLEIDLSKIRNNYRTLSKICKNSMIASVVKANSYGLGADMIAPILQKENCQFFFVTTIDEGIKLRKSLDNTTTIFVLNGIFFNDIKEFKEYKLVPVLNNLQQINLWQEFALHNNVQLPCILHIDTGIHRYAISNREVEQLINNPELLESLEVLYIMSHLSASEEKDNIYNFEQLTKFKYYLQYFPKIKASLSNSGGIFLGSNYHFDLVRPGVALYGYNIRSSDKLLMENPIRLTAPIIHLQELPTNSHIGYNMTFTTKRNSIIATLPFGYADGYSVSLSNCGEVYIDNHKVPVIGRVSMDLTNIDVTDLPPEKIFLGQEVEIFGNYCTLDKIANIIGTISYEILTKFGSRYKRIYK